MGQYISIRHRLDKEEWMGWTARKSEQGWKGAIIGPSEWPQKYLMTMGNGDGGVVMARMAELDTPLADYCLRPPV